MTASVKDVPENDKVLIKPGEKIPADGVIDDGQSSVNEAIVRTREGDLRSRATLLKTVLAKLYGCLDNPDFNPTVNAARRGDEDKGYFLWAHGNRAAPAPAFFGVAGADCQARPGGRSRRGPSSPHVSPGFCRLACTLGIHCPYL